MGNKEGREITINAEALQELVRAEARALLAEELPHQLAPQIRTLEEKFTGDMAAMRGHDRPPLVERMIACKSPATGSTFQARIVESRGWPQGKVVDLVDYTHPDGIDKHVADGGIVPDGLNIRIGADRAGKAKLPDGTEITISVGDFTPEYKMWKYAEYWKRDLVEFVGKPFAEYIRAKPEAAQAAE